MVSELIAVREERERIRALARESKWTDDNKNEVVALVDIEYILDHPEDQPRVRP